MNSNSEKDEMHRSSDKKKNFKFFDWHWSPEDPIELKSIVEMIAFLLIVVICGFLYWRWNTVPKREVDVRIEDLSSGRVYYYPNMRRVLCCELNFQYPMTLFQEYVKDSCTYSLTIKPLYSNEKHSDFMNIAFLKDSIRNLFGLLDEPYKHYINILKKYKLKNDSIFTNIDLYDSIKKEHDSIRGNAIVFFNVSKETSMFAYLNVKEGLPYFQTSNSTSQDTRSLVFKQDTIPYFKSNFLSNNESIIQESYWALESYIFDKPNEIEIPLKPKRRIEKHWYDYFNPYKLIRGGLPSDTPPVFRLEDISQIYLDFNLHSTTIDSLVLSFDFVGVTEFSKMDPMPDEIGMSKIVFRNPIKIYKIKQNGLRFHARFRELENIQEIRVFSVTAIMSAFVLVFIVFAISSYYKIKKKIRRLNKNVRITIHVLKDLVISFLLYCFLFWTLFIFVFKNDKICFLITVALIILILLTTDKHLRSRAKSLLSKKSKDKSNEENMMMENKSIDLSDKSTYPASMLADLSCSLYYGDDYRSDMLEFLLKELPKPEIKMGREIYTKGNWEYDDFVFRAFACYYTHNSERSDAMIASEGYQFVWNDNTIDPVPGFINGEMFCDILTRVREKFLSSMKSTKERRERENRRWNLEPTYEDLMAEIEKRKEYADFYLQDLGEGMIRFRSKGSGNKHYILVNTSLKKMYTLVKPDGEIVGFTREDVDWDNIDGFENNGAERILLAQYYFGVDKYENGIARISWMLYPDGRYFADETGFGMEDNDQVMVYAYIDKECNVLVKFQNMESPEKQKELYQLALNVLESRK